MPASIGIDDATAKILTRHPGTFAGYWKNPRSYRPNHRFGRLCTTAMRRVVDETYVKITTG